MPLAARLHGAADLRISEEERPTTAAEGWSRIAVTSVGICGSDLHWFTEGGIGEVGIDRPVVPGHEFAAVALDGPHAGYRVAVDPAVPCEQCELCHAGHGNLCPTVRFAGHGDLDGGLQEEMVWPTGCCTTCPTRSATTPALCSSRSASPSTSSASRTYGSATTS